MNREIMSSFLIGLLLISVIVANVYTANAGSENPFESAVPIETGTYKGKFSKTNMADGYVFQGKAGRELIVKVTFKPIPGSLKDPRNSIDGEVEFYNKNRKKVLKYSLSGSALSCYARIDEPCTVTLNWLSSTNEPYYIIVKQRYEIDGYAQYVMDVSLEDRFDANSGKDAGDYLDTAITIIPGKYSGYLAKAPTRYDFHEKGHYPRGNDLHDFYTFRLAEGQTINIKATPELDGAVGLTLFGDKGEIEKIYPSDKAEIVDISWMAPSTQDVYIDVTTTEKGRDASYYVGNVYGLYVGGAYTLEVDIEGPTPTPTPTSSPKDSSDSSQESHYFPLIVGNKWVYDVIEEKDGNKEKTGEIVLEILSEENGVYKAILLRKNVEGHTISRSTMDLTYKSGRNAGLYRDGDLVVPDRINNKWSTRFVDTQICNNISKLAGTMETRAECGDDLHTVNVPAGRFEDCARTWFELLTIKGVIYGVQEHIEYFAPRVGLVKYVWNRTTTVPSSVIGGSVSGTYELTEYNIKHPTQQSVHNLNTGEEFPTIQAAINDSDTLNGHTITVDAGTYIENVVVNKQLTIKSTTGSHADTVVQAKNSDGHVFKVTVDYVNISGFTVENATGSYKAGIYLGTGVDHCNVLDNYVSNNDYGIRLYKSSDNTITNNIASSNSKYGIYLYSSSNNILANNSANSNNLDGIRLRSHSNNNTLTNNIANSNSEAGILCWTSSDNILTYNNINLNAYGIWVYNSSCYNILANNSANSNDKYGIRLSSSSNNMIYLNDFVNDGDNIYSYKSTNLFNSSSEIKYTYNGHTHTNYMGNYWSDYKGNDVDKDGIGDTPYSINSNNDEYPLMEPFEYYPTPTPTPTITPTPTPTKKSGPDLVVEDINAIAIRKPSLPSELSSYITSVSFTVKNVGDKPVTEKFYTKILAETYLGGKKEGVIEKTYLAPGASFTETYNFHLMYPAKYITVQTDSSDAIAELNEKNNQNEVETPESESEPETIKSIKIGKSVTLDGIEYTINNVRVIDPKGIGEIVGNLVVVNVMLSVPGKEGVTGWKICRSWAIKDEQDREFKGNNLGARNVYYGIYPGEKPIKSFPPTGLTPGLPRTGNVFFEVPKDSEELKLKVGSHKWKSNYAIIDIETSKIIEECIKEWTKD